MLKFVRTKNFQMPDNRRMTDLQVYRDVQGRFVQEEHWEKDVAVPAPYSSGTVKYKRTYLVTKKPGSVQVDTKTKREYVSSCAGDADTSFQLPSSIKEKIPIAISSLTKCGIPSKGTVFDSLHRRDTCLVHKRPLKCIPEEDIQSVGQIGITDQIGISGTRSEQSEVLEKSPLSNGQSERDIVKLFESLNNEEEIKKESTFSFVYRVTEQKSVKLTVR